MLRAKRNHQLLVRVLLARLVQDAHVSLATVEGLGSLAEPACEPVVDEGDFQDALESVEDGHGTAAGAGVGGNFDFISGGDSGGLFSVRLWYVC